MAARKQKSPPTPEKCAPGSIEQHLDMCEGVNEIRGEEALGHRDTTFRNLEKEPNSTLQNERQMMSNFHVDMAEESREGDDMSGDEHSSGLQGGEQELETQPHPENEMPGDLEKDQEQTVEEQTRRTLRETG